MNTLSRILLSVPDAESLVNDLAATVEAHIAGRGGLSGVAMKTGYAALRAARPEIASRAVRVLLPDIATALEPLYAESATQADVDFGRYLALHAPRAAALIVAVVDRRIEVNPNATVKGIYKRFRGSAANELEKMLPMVGQVLNAHLG